MGVFVRQAGTSRWREEEEERVAQWGRRLIGGPRSAGLYVCVCCLCVCVLLRRGGEDRYGWASLFRGADPSTALASRSCALPCLCVCVTTYG